MLLLGQTETFVSRNPGEFLTFEGSIVPVRTALPFRLTSKNETSDERMHFVPAREQSCGFGLRLFIPHWGLKSASVHYNLLIKAFVTTLVASTASVIIFWFATIQSHLVD